MDTAVVLEEWKSLNDNLSVPLKNIEGIIMSVGHPDYQCMTFKLNNHPLDEFYYIQTGLDQFQKLEKGKPFILVTWDYRSKKYEDIIFVKSIRELVVPINIRMNIQLPVGMSHDITIENPNTILNLLSLVNDQNVKESEISSVNEVKAIVSRCCRYCGKYTSIQCGLCKLLLCISCFQSNRYHKCLSVEHTIVY